MAFAVGVIGGFWHELASEDDLFVFEVGTESVVLGGVEEVENLSDDSPIWGASQVILGRGSGGLWGGFRVWGIVAGQGEVWGRCGGGF